MMKKRIYVKIKASENFWQEQMKKLTFIELRSEPIMLIGDELYIQGEPASTESEIIELSKQNPNEFLIATYIGEDHFENLVSTYRFQYGRRILIEEKYEYFFDISKEDLDALPHGLYEKFQQLAVKYFQKGDKYRVRAYESNPTFQEMPVRPMEDKDDSIFVPSVELWEDGFKIQAKKFGLTYIMVTVGQRQYEPSPRDNDHLSQECDDWMNEENENTPPSNHKATIKNCGNPDCQREKIIEHLKNLQQ
jgi:hypothetical protein